VTTQLSQSGSKVIQSHFHTPTITPNWPQSDPKVILKRSQSRQVDPKWLKVTLVCRNCRQKLPKVNANVPSALKVTQTQPPMPKMTPKVTQSRPTWPQSGSEFTPEPLILWKNTTKQMFLKTDPHMLNMSKVIPKWSKSHPKVIPKRPPSAQSDTKVTSKRPQPVPEWSQIDTTMIHSQPHTPKLNPKWSQSAPIPPSDAQSNAGHTLNWPQSGAKVKSIIQI